MYLTLLGLEMPATDWRCFSYAVMSSHIHLGLVAGEGLLEDWLRPVHTAFASYINDRRERIGGIFVKGPDLIAFRRDGVPHLINYIHNNPVRAGVVARARDSNWTSHHAYVGLTHRSRWLDVEGGLELAGFADGAELERWMDKIRVERDEVDAFRLVPRRPRGRPRTVSPPIGMRG